MDNRINIEVKCAMHHCRLEVSTEATSSGYDIRLLVDSCNDCLRLAVKEADPIDLPPKKAELVFNDSVMTSLTLEV